MVPVLSLRCACPPEDTTRQAQGDCVADSDKAAGGPGRGTAAASIGPHARVDPGARHRPWRLHGFPAHNGPRRNPSEGCGQARSNTGAPDGVVSLARCAPSVHAPWAWRMTSAPLPVRPGKRPRRAAPRRPSMAGLRAPAQPTLGAWRPGGLLPLGVMHGVSELVIAMPAIDIRPGSCVMPNVAMSVPASRLSAPSRIMGAALRGRCRWA